MQIKAYLIPPDLKEEERLKEFTKQHPELQEMFRVFGSPLDDYIILNTSSFNEMPPESQEALKKGMAIFLRGFAKNLLAASHFYFASQGEEKEALKAIEEELKLMDEKLDEVAKRLEKRFPKEI